MPLASGDRFGRYAILGPLGRGGMGEVYRARDTVLHRDVALKVLAHDEAEGSRAGDASLLREARAAAALQHPNVVTVFDVGEVDGVGYIAMELLSGKPLRAYVGDGAVPVRRRVGWLADAARALAAAHAQGIVHRDVKPENVFVRDDGVVKVLDFGIARHATMHVDPTGHTQLDATQEAGARTLPAAGETAHGASAGTPAYMSPEQMRGGAVGAASDQFSWGVMAYELLAGGIPWDLEVGTWQLVAQVLSRTPQPPSARAPEIPRAVDAVVMRALEKAPESRFASMNDVVAALAEAPAPTARTEAAPPAEAPAPRRRRARASLLLLAACGVAAAALLVIFGQRLFARAAPPPKAPPAASAPVAREVRVGEGVDDEASASSNPEARAAYRAAIQAMRDGSDRAARAGFARAAALDPGFAAAHLRHALMFGRRIDDDTRESYRRALELRDALPPRLRVLLPLLEPLVRVSDDRQELVRRVAALPADAARDAETQYAACRLLAIVAGDYAAARRACATALAVDPQLAAARRLEGFAFLREGDPAAAAEAYRACLAIAPNATSCLDDLYDVEMTEGHCAAAVDLARRQVALDPSARAYGLLATSLLAAGEPTDSAWEALALSWRGLSPDARALEETRTRIDLATLEGRFDETAPLFAKWERAIAGNSDEIAHEELHDAHVLVALEAGKNTEAAKVSREYLAQRDAWTRYAGFDLSILALDVLYVSGDLPRAAFRERRAAWADRMGAHERRDRGMQWILGFAVPVMTREDAEDALAILPRYEPLPSAYERNVSNDAKIGRTYLRAGRAGEALPYLRRAATSCYRAQYVCEGQWAAYDLADALAQMGDPSGACAALAPIFARWGHASPRSLTFERARALASTLGCR